MFCDDNQFAKRKVSIYMTFQSNLDVWADEALSSSLMRPLTAREIIRIAATGAFNITVARAASGFLWGSVVAAWTRAWKQILFRKISWVAATLTLASRAMIDAWELLKHVGGKDAQVEPRALPLSEAEVEASVTA